MSNPLTPEKLVQRVLDKVDTDHDTTRKLVQELFNIITEQLKSTDRMSLYGFGTFKRIFVEESTGRNPHTNETISIAAHYRVKFTPSSVLAHRINADYSHLKPIMIEDEVHEGLLMKALKLEQSLTETEAAEIEMTAVKTAEEPVFESEQSQKSGIKKTLITGVALVAIILLLGGLYMAGKARDSQETVPSEIKKNIVLQADPEKAPEPAPPAAEAPKADTPEEGPSRSYTITTGDSFSILARELWNNIHLWPYLYSKNRDAFPDPDFIHPGDSIIIPQKPDKELMIDDIESSILMAYERYRSLIKDQSDSSRNANRTINARYVIAGGETLHPGFLDRYKNRIDAEDIRKSIEMVD
ncbi:MAG: hypothetical protein B6241_13925 [Spirochaetaceae bacterium 4572_59]|nr:MAG: hypothetical protein B6241_13925 [Spirochaetaceae bacterium 4572_59]